MRLSLTITPTGWRITATQRDQTTIHEVPATDFLGRRLPCPAGEDAATLAKRLAPTTAAEALAAGRWLFSTFVPPGLAFVDHLVIEAAPDDPALRLPWNLLADDQGHLLARGAVSREIRGDAAPSTPLVLPLRVLFVVAAGLDEPGIAAGAEYLGLLRRLESAGHLLEHTVRVRPTLAAIEATVTTFRPQVLHWIGHGDPKGLRLTDPDFPTITAGQLAQVCKNIPVLVLNACHSAGGEEAVTPLAVELVRQGVPVVVGMQGRAKDKACRLFTWQLYRALAAGEPLPAAVAEGQRVGLVDQPDRLEWARPALFLRPGAMLTPDPTGLDAARKAYHIRRTFQPQRPFFCGRFEVLAAAAEVGTKTTAALLIRLDPRGLTDRQRDRVGLTWLLDEVGGRLAAAGRVPVELLFHDARTPMPMTWAELARGLVDSIRRSFRDLGLEGKPGALRAFAEAVGGLDPLDIVDEFVKALRADLGALQAACDRLPVLVLDDLHRLKGMGAALLSEGLGPYGLGTAAQPVPVVAAFVESDLPDHEGAILGLKSFLDQAAYTVRVMTIAPFAGDEERLAYQQFLAGQAEPLVLSGADDEKAWDFLNGIIEGVPSRLPNEGKRMVAVLLKHKLVEVADDEALLKRKAP